MGSICILHSGGQPGVVVRPGVDEANITIENDDGYVVQVGVTSAVAAIEADTTYIQCALC